jgi:hypothetical protein
MSLPSLREITIEINDALVLERPHLDAETRAALIAKLCGYIYVDELRDLQPGRFYRWMAEEADTLATGGILVETRFLDAGVHLLFRSACNYSGGVRQVPIKDGTLLFQKLTTEDQLRVLGRIF